MSNKKTQFVYAADRTCLEGKQGKLKKDANGYYQCLLGAYNIYNSAGEFYEMTARVNMLFAESSFLQRRVKAGKLYGENDHPAIDPYIGKPNMMALWADRLRDIRMANVGCHYDALWLDPLPRQERGQTVIGVWGAVLPKTDILQSSLDNPKENTSFSQRAFSTNRQVGLEMHREVTEIITYDPVTSGGVADACKYQTPSLESDVRAMADSLSFAVTDEMLDAMQRLEDARKEAALENSNIIPVTRIRDGFNSWREVPTMELTMSTNRASRGEWV